MFGDVPVLSDISFGDEGISVKTIEVAYAYMLLFMFGCCELELLLIVKLLMAYN